MCIRDRNHRPEHLGTLRPGWKKGRTLNIQVNTRSYVWKGSSFSSLLNSCWDSSASGKPDDPLRTRPTQKLPLTLTEMIVGREYVNGYLAEVSVIIANSMRRFFFRPSSLALLATGRNSAKPDATKRLPGTRHFS